MSLKRAVVTTLTQLGLVEAINEVRGAATLLSPRLLAGNSQYRRRGAPDGQPIPPSRLIYLVSGAYDIDWFLTLGERGAHAIRETLARNGVAIESMGSLLDFGCGCGRVIRYFSNLTGAAIHGSDYNERLVEWCSVNLKFATFRPNQLEPPLSYDAATFDFVYSLSVFTHWGENLQLAWMKEMRRIIRPGGYLLMTIHGESYLKGLSDLERAQFASGELVVRRGHLPGKNICTAFCSEQYVRTRLADGCSVVDFVPEGALGNPTQDLYLLRFT